MTIMLTKFKPMQTISWDFKIYLYQLRLVFEMDARACCAPPKIQS